MRASEMRLQQSITFTGALLNWSLGGRLWVTALFIVFGVFNTVGLVLSMKEGDE